jgi:hypothetical protein
MSLGRMDVSCTDVGQVWHTVTAGAPRSYPKQSACLEYCFSADGWWDEGPPLPGALLPRRRGRRTAGAGRLCLRRSWVGSRNRPERMSELPDVGCYPQVDETRNQRETSERTPLPNPLPQRRRGRRTAGAGIRLVESLLLLGLALGQEPTGERSDGPLSLTLSPWRGEGNRHAPQPLVHVCFLFKHALGAKTGRTGSQSFLTPAATDPRFMRLGTNGKRVKGHLSPTLSPRGSQRRRGRKTARQPLVRGELPYAWHMPWDWAAAGAGVRAS